MNSTSLRGYATALCVLIGSLALASCNQQTGSDVKTLDNFARTGDLVVNKCSGSFPIDPAYSSLVTRKHMALLPVLKEAVRSVPPRLQRAFFKADGGNVGIIENADAVCRQVLADVSGIELSAVAEREKEIRGCFHPDAKTKSLLLYVNADQTSVQHATVRMFGYAMSDYYGPRWFTNWSATTLELSKLFLQDIHHSSELSIAPYETMFKTPEGLDRFAELVFADAFDSYYCSDSTRAKMAKTFPRTFLGFRTLAKQIESEDKQ